MDVDVLEQDAEDDDLEPAEIAVEPEKFVAASVKAKKYAKETAPEEKDSLQRLIALQTFEGFWEFDAPLLNVLAVSDKHKAPEGLDLRSWATILAITCLEKKMGAEREAWEMCADKARDWLAGVGVVDGQAAEGWWARAEELVTGSK
jgi:hypothetical protein